MNIISHVTENMPNSGSVWFSIILCSNAKILGSVRWLSSAKSITQSYIFRFIHSWTSLCAWWFQYWLDSITCAAPFCDASDFRVRRSQNRAVGLCRTLPPEIITISMSIMDLVFYSGDFRDRTCPIIFSKRLGVCNAFSTLMLLHNQITHIATSHRA